MINPIIFKIPFLNWPVHWYGLILMTGFLVGAWMVERELKRYGENGELIWDVAVWVLIPGVLGARLWYVLNATLGGDTRFSNNPIEIIRVWNGGLHIFGAFLFGGAGPGREQGEGRIGKVVMRAPEIRDTLALDAILKPSHGADFPLQV